jgi:threonine/homoserine/homoserine lactone efflux protein
MDSNLSLSTAASLFGVMVILAAIPSSSVLMVTTRSASSGFTHGILTTLGIVTGDILYIVVAVFGLSTLARSLGDQFVLIKYAGGVFLIWMGLSLWRSGSSSMRDNTTSRHSLVSSYVAGLLLTLADQKAIVFYLGFFPAFIDFSRLHCSEAFLVIAIAVVAVGGPKIAYAYLASISSFHQNVSLTRWLNTTAGLVMIAIGILLVFRH